MLAAVCMLLLCVLFFHENFSVFFKTSWSLINKHDNGVSVGTKPLSHPAHGHSRVIVVIYIWHPAD